MTQSSPEKSKNSDFIFIYRFGVINDILSDRGYPIVKEDIQKEFKCLTSSNTNIVGVYQMPLHKKPADREGEILMESIRRMTSQHLLYKNSKEEEKIPSSLISLIFDPLLNNKEEIEKILNFGSSTQRVTIFPSINVPVYEEKFSLLTPAHKETSLEAIKIGLCLGGYDEKIEKLTAAMYPFSVSNRKYGLTLDELAKAIQLEMVFDLARLTEGEFGLPIHVVDSLINAQRRVY